MSWFFPRPTPCSQIAHRQEGKEPGKLGRPCLFWVACLKKQLPPGAGWLL